MPQQYSAHVEGKKNYHRAPTGKAKILADEHSTEQDLTLFGSCFCPFVHRAWILLELSGLPYTYCEVDVYAKPQALLDVNEKGFVPALKISPTRALAESLVIMEYIAEVADLLPKDPYKKAVLRLQIDHISKGIIPHFYKYLQAQDADGQAAGRKAFVEGLEKLISLFEKANKEGVRLGLFGSARDPSIAEISVAPWIMRSQNVLKHYRGFEPPETPTYRDWAAKLLAHPAVAATSSDEELYLDSYARYAENRPNTSRVAEATNSGSILP